MPIWSARMKEEEEEEEEEEDIVMLYLYGMYGFCDGILVLYR